MARSRRRLGPAALVIERDPLREAARIEITGIPAGTVTFTLARSSPSGNTVDVRGAVRQEVEGDVAIVRDWEIPLGVRLDYVATFYDADGNVLGTASASWLLDWGDCRAWLVDLARPTNSLALTIESLTQLQFEVPSGVHRVLDRRAPVVTTLPAWTPSAELVMLTDTLVERTQVRAILGSGYPVLLRTRPADGIGNLYLSVTDFSEERIVHLGDAPYRRFLADVVQVERPDPAVFGPRAPNTYAHVAATFADYAELLAVARTYDELAYQFDVDPDYSPVVPWLPSDV